MKLKVYQIDGEKNRLNAAFRNYNSIMSDVGKIEPSIYKCVYDGELDCNNLEDVFAYCNENHIVGYNGHSLSVSDIVDIEDDGCYFCDSVGFKKLDEFDSSKVEPITGYRMLVLEPHKEPYEMIIPKGLEPLQQAVDGYIECTYPFDDDVFVVGNEEAKLIGMEGNRRINGEIYVGPLLIAGDDGKGGTKNLTDEQIKKYTEQFQNPEDISQGEVEDSLRSYVIGFN